MVLLSPLGSPGTAGGRTGAEGLRLLGLRPKEDIGLRLLLGLTKFDTRFFLAAAISKKSNMIKNKIKIIGNTLKTIVKYKFNTF